MKRRAFLASLAAATLDPERLLWRPGAKVISIPAPAKIPVFKSYIHAFRLPIRYVIGANIFESGGKLVGHIEYPGNDRAYSVSEGAITWFTSLGQ